MLKILRIPKPDLASGILQRGLILSAALLAVMYVYFFTNFLPFFYPPREATVKELRVQVEKLDAEVEQAKRTAANLPRLEKEMAELHVRWAEATKLLPPEKEVATLLRKVTVAGQQSGIDFHLFEPTEPVPNTFYTEHPVNVKVQGGYHDLGGFLAGLAGMTRIVNVTNLDLSAIDPERGPKDQDEEEELTVEAAMTITAYSLGVEHVNAVEAEAKSQGNEVNANAAVGKVRRSASDPDPE